MSVPKVSIIIPCYNMGSFVSEAIKSVENVFEPVFHEIIVVNDGSTDKKTIEVLSEIHHHEVIHQENKGLAGARNTGITNAKGEYLIFLDADNLLTDGYLTKGLEIMERDPEIDIIYGDSERFGEKSKDWGIRSFNLQTLMLYNYIDACCLVRRKVFDELGGFDEKMPVTGSEDWEMWLRSAFNGKRFFYMKGVVIQKYRVRKDSMIRTKSKKERDAIQDYLQNKFPEFMSFTDTSNFYYSKFASGGMGWIFKLYTKKYFPNLYNKMVKKGTFSKYL